jgi:hypothetical protein
MKGMRATIALCALLAVPGQGQGVLYTAAGTVHRVDGAGNAAVLECTRVSQIVGLEPEQLPCDLGDLVVDPKAGRYALTVDVPASFHEDGALLASTTRLRVANEDVALPRQPGGGPLEGSLVVVGDLAGGRPVVMRGVPASWRSDGRFHPQMPMTFTRDGAGLLVVEWLGAERARLWMVDLQAAPRWRVALGGRVFQRITLAPGSAAFEVHVAPGRVALVDIPESVDSALQLTERHLPGTLAVAQVDDTVLSFAPGDCSAKGQGRYLRTGVSGESTGWRLAPLCSTRDTVLLVSQSRHSAFYFERQSISGPDVLFEYRVGDAVTNEYPHDPHAVRALTHDGRALALVRDGVLKVQALDGGVWWQTEVAGPADAVRVAFF